MSLMDLASPMRRVTIAVKMRSCGLFVGVILPLWSIRGRYSPFVALSVDGSGLVMIRPSVLEGELTDDPDVVFMYRSGELVRSYRFSDVSMPDSQMAWPGTGKIVWADGRIVGGFDADNEFSDILFAVPGSGSFRVFWSGRNASVVNENRGVIEGPLPSTGEVHLRESEYAISHLEWHPVHAIGGIVVGLVIAWCYRLIRGGRGVA